MPPTPPTAPAVPDADAPRDIEQEDRHWLQHVYQGDRMRQLSPRAVISGMLIGGVMSISNLYVGLKTGWGLGVTITACIIAYAVFKALEAVIPAYRRDPFTMLENLTMSSAASAAGYIASAGLVSALPALYMCGGRELAWWETMAWLAAVASLGVMMAVPLKRQMINHDKLPFPTGTATAETLQSLHAAGAAAIRKARTLLFSGIGGAIVALWRDGLPMLGQRFAAFAFPSSMPLYPGGTALLEKYTLGFEGSLIMVAAGAIMGIRVGVSLLVGSIFFFGILAPILDSYGMLPGYGYRNVVQWTLWPATAMMVTSGLLSFAMKWRTVLRAFSGLTRMFGGQPNRAEPTAHIEVPGSWFAIGVGVSGTACVLLGHYLFGIAIWMGVLAVVVTFLLAIVAARATGETDVTPIGAMGKITQLIYGVVAPSNMTTNLMTASITAGSASHAADLLTDLKAGYLVGGSPRSQTVSQLFGVLAGVLICVPVYSIVARPDRLGTEELPAPAAQVWAGVAKLLSQGIDKLPPGTVYAMFAGAALGVVITLAEEFLPRKYRPYIPSATGLGISGVVPAYNSISMFLGAFLAWLWWKARPAAAEEYTIPASSGLIAGESLMGVAIILAAEGPGMIKTLLGW